MKWFNEQEVEHLPVIEKWDFPYAKYNIRRVSKDMPVLFVLQIHITDFCNLKCKHCYVEDDRNYNMPFSMFMKIIDDFMNFMQRHRYMGEILITGGEPILHPELFDMLEYLYSKYIEGYPFKIVIETNGTLISEQIMDTFELYKEMIYEFQVSIDGMEEIHDTNRGPGNWKLSEKAIELIKCRGFHIAISSVITKKNCYDIEKVLVWAKQKKVRRITVSRLIPLGNNIDYAKESVLDKQEFALIWERLYKVADELIKEVVAGESETFLCMQRCDLWHLTDMERSSYQWRVSGTPRYLLAGTACQAGINILAIKPDGTVYPCRRFPYSIGNLSNCTIGEIWKSSQLLKEFRGRAIKMKGKCKNCRYLNDPIDKKLCSGGAPCLSKALGFSIYDPDPMCYKDEVEYAEDEMVEV